MESMDDYLKELDESFRVIKLGDVLTGIITGLLGYQQDNILFTVSLGAFINGLAGEIAAKKFGEISMLSSDTISSIPDAIMRIIN